MLFDRSAGTPVGLRSASANPVADVIAEEQAVELDEVVGGEPAGADVMDGLDEQPIARLAGRTRWKPNLKAFGMAFDGQLPTGSKGINKTQLHQEVDSPARSYGGTK